MWQLGYTEASRSEAELAIKNARETSQATTRCGNYAAAYIEPHPGPPGEQLNSLRIENVSHDAIAGRLQAEAKRMRADLIVVGAFGHPRLWEKMLGAVTHDLLVRMRLPLFHVALTDSVREVWTRLDRKAKSETPTVDTECGMRTQ